MTGGAKSPSQLKERGKTMKHCIMIYHVAGCDDWCKLDGENIQSVEAYKIKWRLLLSGAKREIQQDKAGDYVEYIEGA